MADLQAAGLDWLAVTALPTWEREGSGGLLFGRRQDPGGQWGLEATYAYKAILQGLGGRRSEGGRGLGGRFGGVGGGLEVAGGWPG